MEIIIFIWQNYLYTPLFNLLIWLYLNYAFFKLGIAIILLTILVRLVLLPFSILNERSKLASQRLLKEIREIKKDFADDPVKQKEIIRQLLKRKKIRPWAKAVTLGVQGLILLLLYQVFIGGINSNQNLRLLYSSISRPDFINTKFLWFDIAEPNLLIAAIVAGYLFVQIALDAWQHKRRLHKKDAIFTIFFPLFVFLILAILPAAKSVFVLTSLIFSSIISIFTIFFKLNLKKAQQEASLGTMPH